MTQEEWKDIPNFSRYAVSNKGNIMSKLTVLTVEDGSRVYKKKQHNRTLKPRHRYDGRLWIPLINDQQETKQIFLAHVVAELFIPNPYKYQYVAFKDGDMSNCVAENLYWSDVDPRVMLDDFKIPNLPNEEWRPIKKYPNYMVSNYARVKSIATVIEYKDGRRRQRREKLKPQTNKDGYFVVRLFAQGNQKGVLVKVHRLVAEAFIPNPENKPYIDHINTVRGDNRIENLRWVTSSENSRNPITLERNRQISSERMKDPMERIKVSNGVKKRYEDPEYRAMVLESNRTKEVRRKRSMNGTHKNVLHYDADGNFIERFHSTREAAQMLGVPQPTISYYCRGKRFPKNKHIWKYE